MGFGIMKQAFRAAWGAERAAARAAGEAASIERAKTLSYISESQAFSNQSLNRNAVPHSERIFNFDRGASAGVNPYTPGPGVSNSSLLELMAGSKEARYYEQVNAAKSEALRELSSTQRRATMSGARSSGFSSFSKGVDQAQASARAAVDAQRASVMAEANAEAARWSGKTTVRSTSNLGDVIPGLTMKDRLGRMLSGGSGGPIAGRGVSRLLNGLDSVKKTNPHNPFNINSTDSHWLQAVKAGGNSIIDKLDGMTTGGFVKSLGKWGMPGVAGAGVGAVTGMVGNIVAPNNIEKDSFVKSAFKGAATGMALGMAGRFAGAANNHVSSLNKLGASASSAAWMQKPLGIVEKVSNHSLTMGALGIASAGSAINFNSNRPLNGVM